MSDDPLRPSVAADLGSLAGVFAAGRAPRLEPGTTIGGHFEIEEVLGQGGMGTVYRARDTRLGRAVALKLDLRGGDLTRAQREAEALARLAHPNVVTIYEVGPHDGGTFVAMELCEGGTARTWLAERRGDDREVLRVYLEAGRGLAAAHAAGLVHRDVKPDNILVGGDGRARIGDFGLAHDAARPDEAPDGGTPRYMAPEQVAGDPGAAAADQFAYCVALYEALAGADPFPPLPAERAAAIAARRFTPPRPGRTVSRRVLAALTRGLAPAPAERFPSMTALLDELARATRRRAWWPAVLAAAAVIAAGGVVAIAVRGGEAAPVPGCEPAAVRLRGIWDAAARGRLADAGVIGREAAAAIDRRVAAWSDARLTTCRELRRGGEAGATAAVRLTCLEQRFADLGPLLAQLAAAPGDRRLAERVDGLPPIEQCADPAGFSRREPQPAAPALRAQVAADRASLRSAQRLIELGRADDAAAALAALTTPRGAFAPLDAEAAHARAGLAGARHDAAAAIAGYREAASLAAAAHHPHAHALALLQLAFVLAERNVAAEPHAKSEIETLLSLAEGAAQATGDAELIATFLRIRGGVRLRLGDLAAAVADATAARDRQHAVSGVTSPAGLRASQQLGGALIAAGKTAEARAVLAPALAAADASLPPTHLLIRSLLSNLAAALEAEGELALARTLRERLLRITREALGDDDLELDGVRLDLAGLQIREGRFAEAVPLLESVLASLARRGRGASADAAMVEGNLGIALAAGGRPADAIPHLERSLAGFEKTVGADHPQLIGSLAHLAGALHRSGRDADAVPVARRAVAIATAAFPADSPRLVKPLATLALALAASAPAEARTLAERALKLSNGKSGPAGEAAFARALALHALDQRRAAVAAAEQAAAVLAAAGPMAAVAHAEAEAWLAAHR